MAPEEKILVMLIFCLPIILIFLLILFLLFVIAVGIVKRSWLRGEDGWLYWLEEHCLPFYWLSEWLTLEGKSADEWSTDVLGFIGFVGLIIILLWAFVTSPTTRVPDAQVKKQIVVPCQSSPFPRC